MAFWCDLQDLADVRFKRLTGVEKRTFLKMTEILSSAEKKKKAQGGKPSKLCLEDRLLMTLEYMREYRTYFHISQDYGLSESSCYRCVTWIENTLIKDGTFSLPGKKELLKSDTDYEAVMIDATETPVERPKKDSVGTIRAKKSDIP